MAELTNPAAYSKMSILNLFSPDLNHKTRRKPAPRLALSPIVHFLNARQMLKMLKFANKILDTQTTITLRNCRRGFLTSIQQSSRHTPCAVTRCRVSVGSVS